jgi:hypothetical protein
MATAAASVPLLHRGESSEDDGEVSQEIVTANLVHRPAGRGVLVGIASLVVLLLVIIPGYFVLSESGTNSPGYAGINALDVPSWASQSPHDAAFYSRFCVDECQLVERDATSSKSAADTESAYVTALHSAGWKKASASDCATKVTGSYSCWLLDARELDLWITAGGCTTLPATRTGLPDPSESTPPKTCTPTTVQLKIFDQAERARVRSGSTG